VTKEGETGNRRRRLCGADRLPARCPHREGETADGAPEQAAAKKVYEKSASSSKLADRAARRQCAFGGRRIVIFSGGEAKDTEAITPRSATATAASARSRPQLLPAAEGRSGEVCRR
jgi:hypothetical protein